ncbi:MAG: cyclodeaminase/cyclohydrolase family protein [Planctomycetota bacterium]
MSEQTPPMSEGSFATAPLASVLDEVAAKQPAPGGGAVAALTGAMSAALGSMVLSYSSGRTSLADHTELHTSTSAALVRARALFLELADADAEAYAALQHAQRAAREGSAAPGTLVTAAEHAMGVPVRVVVAAGAVAEHFERAVEAEAINRWLLSDLAIAAELAASAARSAMWMVRTNGPLVAEHNGDLVPMREAETIADATSERASRIADAVARAIASSEPGG